MLLTDRYNAGVLDNPPNHVAKYMLLPLRSQPKEETEKNQQVVNNIFI